MRWQAALDRNNDPRDGSADRPRPASRARVIAAAIAEFDANPDQLAHALRTYLGADGVATLMAQLRSLTS